MSTPKLQPPAHAPSVTMLDCLVAIYLVLPNLIYLAGWVKPIYGVPAAILTSIILTTLLRNKTVKSDPIKSSLLVLAAVIAAVWIYFSGTGHFTYANSDWVFRDAVLADLTNESWPVTYPADDSGQERLLRAPLGYFLPAAVIGKLLGSAGALWALTVWSFLGVLLVFAYLLLGVQNVRSALIRLLIFVFFSGMDFIGFMRHGNLPGWGKGLEWWGGFFQYSSNMTAMFWVPNHTIAGWVAVLWLHNQLRKQLNVKLAMFFILCVPLFSPLAAVGLIPLFGTAILCGGQLDDGNWRKRVLQVFDPRIVGTALIFAVLIYGYLTTAPAKIPMQWAFQGMNFHVFPIYYVTFVILEFLAINVLLLKRFPDDRLLWACMITLLFFPWTQVGPGKDLTMRGSLPALAYMAVKLAEWLSEPKADNLEEPSSKSHSSEATVLAAAKSQRADLRNKRLAWIIFAIGCITPFQEITRTVITPSWPYQPMRSVVDIPLRPSDDHLGPSHYVCPRKTPWTEIFLP